MRKRILIALCFVALGTGCASEAVREKCPAPVAGAGAGFKPPGCIDDPIDARVSEPADGNGPKTSADVQTEAGSSPPDQCPSPSEGAGLGFRPPGCNDASAADSMSGTLPAYGPRPEQDDASNETSGPLVDAGPALPPDMAAAPGDHRDAAPGDGAGPAPDPNCAWDCAFPSDTSVHIWYAPVINNPGKVAVVVSLRGPAINDSNRYALLYGTPGNWRVIARQGGAVPGDTGVFSKPGADERGPFRTAPHLNDSGAISFMAVYSREGHALFGADTGLFVGGKLIAKHGSPAPDFPNRTFHQDWDLVNAPGIGRDGTYAVGLTLVGDGYDPVDPDTGQYAGRGNDVLRPVAHRLDPVPGTAGKFRRPDDPSDWLGFGPPEINPAGVIAFGAWYKTDVTGPYDNGHHQAFFLYTDKLSRLIGYGDASPDGDGVFGDAFTDVKAASDITSSSQVAIRTRIGGDYALVVARPAHPPVLVARDGRPAPGGGVFTDLKFHPAINDRGEVAFASQRRQSTLHTTLLGDAVFLGKPGELARIVAAGDPLPEGGGTFKSFSESSLCSTVRGNRMNLNEQGKLMIPAEVRLADDRLECGLYFWNGAALRKIVRTGDLVGGRPVKEIGFQSIESSGVRGLNDSCTMTYALEYKVDSTLQRDRVTELFVEDACSR